jgi:hypothetical protein
MPEVFAVWAARVSVSAAMGVEDEDARKGWEVWRRSLGETRGDVGMRVGIGGEDNRRRWAVRGRRRVSIRLGVSRQRGGVRLSIIEAQMFLCDLTRRIELVLNLSCAALHELQIVQMTMCQEFKICGELDPRV